MLEQASLRGHQVVLGTVSVCDRAPSQGILGPGGFVKQPSYQHFIPSL